MQIRCGTGAQFCLVSCDLGCSQTGCAISEIAENQRLKFTFSGDLAVGSVNASTVSIRTAAGVAPDGDLSVAGNVLTFVPGVRTQNGISTFGFQRNESYIISIAGGDGAAFGVRSTAGDPLLEPFTCTVIASRGIIDEDQQPPRVEMIAPTNLTGVPRDPTVTLRFSELIDTTPLRGTLTPSSPIRVTLRTTDIVNGSLVCNRDTQGLVLEGIPRLRTEQLGDTSVTVVEFRPEVVLPGLACVEVVVTADLRDLSGRAAEPNRFEFFTVEGTSVLIRVTESFANPGKLDERVSSGTWLNGARPGLIGGDGRHGSFNPEYGTPLGTNSFRWDTSSIDIPAEATPSGQSFTVTDGKFYFTDMTVPEFYEINFVGPAPAQIWVRGKVDIQGRVLANGKPVSNFNARGGLGTTPQPYIAGMPGTEPGAGGGWGGRGGNECQGNGPIIIGGEVMTDGADGGDVKVLAGHAYATATIDTGGKGAEMNPPTGEAQPNNPTLGFGYRAFFAPGGGGGGFVVAGTEGTITPVTGLQVGPIPAGGLQFDPLPLPAGASSLDHFTIGGAGGGGGATHAFGTTSLFGDVYIAGSAGTGAGGAVAIRAGNDISVAADAVIEAKGGLGVHIDGRRPAGSPTNIDWGIPSPGGGGSGGSLVLQSGGDLDMFGSMDVSGAAGSTTGNIGVTVLNVQSSAGDGSDGFYRVEAAGNLRFLGNAVPAYNASINNGPLLDRDDLVGCSSKWYGTNQVFPPAWLYYELDVDPDGPGPMPVVTYTDTGEPGTQTASTLNDPLRIQFQGAQLSQSTLQPVPGTLGPWRNNVGPGAGPGIGLDSPTGFRFTMIFNRSLFPDCVVLALRVHARA